MTVRNAREWAHKSVDGPLIVQYKNKKKQVDFSFVPDFGLGAFLD